MKARITATMEEIMYELVEKTKKAEAAGIPHGKEEALAGVVKKYGLQVVGVADDGSELMIYRMRGNAVENRRIHIQINAGRGMHAQVEIFKL